LPAQLLQLVGQFLTLLVRRVDRIGDILADFQRAGQRCYARG
jgi:hypothetical protein